MGNCPALHASQLTLEGIAVVCCQLEWGTRALHVHRGWILALELHLPYHPVGSSQQSAFAGEGSVMQCRERWHVRYPAFILRSPQLF